MSDGPAGFRAAAAAAGLVLPATLIADGQYHRFSTRSDRPGDDTGWYVWDGDHGAAGDWRRTGAEPLVRWSARSRGGRSDAAEIARLRAVADAGQAEANRRKAQKRGDAAREAQAVWAAAAAAPADHGYLTAKGVRAHGLRIFSGAGTWRRKIRDMSLLGCLVIPLRDPTGTIQSLEFVAGAGKNNKRFLTGGRKQGCYYELPGDSTVIVVCEGYATGASLHEATGYTVICAMDKDNLRSVAQAVRSAHPDTLIVLAGDHDSHGAGQRAAKEAAEAVHGLVAVPGRVGADWNDVHQAEGLEAVRAAIDDAIRAHIQGTPEGRAALAATAQPVSMHTGPRLTAALARARPGAGIQTESADVEAARARIRAAVQSRLDALRTWSDDTATAVIRITVGAGKSSSAIDTIANDPDVRAGRHRVLVVVADHDQASRYVRALTAREIRAAEYYGRTAPREGVSDDAQPDTTCWRLSAAREVAGQHHPLAASYCRICPHGLLAASLSAAPAKAAEAHETFSATCRRQSIDPMSVQPCQFLYAAMPRYHKADVLVLPHQAYTPKLTRGEIDPFGGAEVKPCLVVIDEGVPLTRALTVRLADIDKWAARTRDWADRLHRGCDPQAVHPAIFRAFGFLTTAIGERGRNPDTLAALRDALDAVSEKYGDDLQHGGTWVWEAVRWAQDDQGRETGEIDAPLRALETIRAALAGRSAASTWGDLELRITAVTALGQHVCGGDTVLMDATVNDRTVAAIRACAQSSSCSDRVSMLDVRVEQRAELALLAGRSYTRGLRTAPWYEGAKARNTGDLAAVLGAISVAHRDGQRLWGVITHKSLVLEDAVQRALQEFGGPVEIGYWGRDERAHNRWSGRNLLLLGLPWPSPTTMQEKWDQLRAFDPSLPSTPPTQFAAELVAADVAQAVGRSRAIYADPHDPIQVIIAAHVTPELGAELGKYGLYVTEERKNPLAGRAPRDEAAVLRILIAELDRRRRDGDRDSTSRDALAHACRAMGLHIGTDAFDALLTSLVPPEERGGKRHRDPTRYVLLLLRRAREALRALDTAARRTIEAATEGVDATLRPRVQRILEGLGDWLRLTLTAAGPHTGPPPTAAPA